MGMPIGTSVQMFEASLCDAQNSKTGTWRNYVNDKAHLFPHCSWNVGKDVEKVDNCLWKAEKSTEKNPK